MNIQQAVDQILALAEDERADGEFEGPEHEEWRAEMRALMTKLFEEAVRQTVVNLLKQAILNYLDHPGCNNPARATAMAKLRWAAEQA
jgi:hypothetical protein